MTRKLLIAIGFVIVLGLVGAAGVGIAAAEGTVGGRGVRTGTILSLEDDQLTIEMRQGELALQVDQDTHIRIPGSGEVALDSLAVGDRVAVAGRLAEDGTATARLIVRLPLRQDAGRVSGVLSAIDGDQLEIKRADGRAVTVLVDDETRLRIPGIEQPALSNLLVGDLVYAQGLWNEAVQLEARLVGRLPAGVESVLRGRVLDKDADSLELLTREGPYTVLVDENTGYRIPGIDDPTLAEVAIGDEVTAGGALTEGGFQAVLIAVCDEGGNWASRRGTIVGIDADVVTLETGAGRMLRVEIDEHTRFRVAGIENATLADIEVGFQALVAGRYDAAEGVLLARVIGARPAPAGE